MEKLGQEWVSAAVDGEVDHKAIEDLSEDTASHEKWRNYHIIGDALRNDLPSSMDIDLSERIAEALEDEPLIHVSFADSKVGNKTQESDAISENTEVIAEKPKAKVIPLFKQFGQYAIAASVALVTIIGVQNYNQTEKHDSAPLSVLDTRPLVGNVSPVSLQTGPVRQYQHDTNEQMNEQRRLLNIYIQDHMLQQRLNSGRVLNDNTSNHLSKK